MPRATLLPAYLCTFVWTGLMISCRCRNSSGSKYAEPVLDGRIRGPLRDAIAKSRQIQQVRNFEDRVLRAASRRGVHVAHRLVGLEQGHESEAERVFHARA